MFYSLSPFAPEDLASQPHPRSAVLILHTGSCILLRKNRNASEPSGGKNDNVEVEPSRACKVYYEFLVE